jgi:phosphatidylserine/phosphatidylglycerophosphate/cardiolipin synthase-like enzyme
MNAWARTCRICIGVSVLSVSFVFIRVPEVWASTETGLAHVTVAFSPRDDVAGLIVDRIAKARESVQVQAYLFTDRRIANALLAARKRGVEVEVIGDAAQNGTGGHPHLKALDRAGARVYLNGMYAAAHDKVVILDGRSDGAAVITGSYNFTRSAQAKNAENVVVISGNRAVTDRFVDNFALQRSHSRPWR